MELRYCGRGTRQPSGQRGSPTRQVSTIFFQAGEPNQASRGLLCKGSLAGRYEAQRFTNLMELCQLLCFVCGAPLWNHTLRSTRFFQEGEAQPRKQADLARQPCLGCFAIHAWNCAIYFGGSVQAAGKSNHTSCSQVQPGKQREAALQGVMEVQPLSLLGLWEGQCLHKVQPHKLQPGKYGKPNQASRGLSRTAEIKAWAASQAHALHGQRGSQATQVAAR